MEELRETTRQHMREAGQEVVDLALKLAWDTRQACQDPVAWGPEPALAPDPEHPERPANRYMSFGLMETFYKMRAPVMGVQTGLRFFAWDHAVSQSAEQQGADDDGRR